MQEAVHTECQSVLKNVEDTAVKIQTVNKPVKTSVEKSYAEKSISDKKIEVTSKKDSDTEETSEKSDLKNESGSFQNDLSEKESMISQKSESTSSKAKNNSPKTKSTSSKTEDNASKANESTRNNNSVNESKTNKNTSSKGEKSFDTDKTKCKPVIKNPPKEYHIKIKHITQFKDMPTGCEIVSTKMILDYYGKNSTYKDMLSHMEMDNLKLTKEHKLYGKTPFQAFLGDPTKSSGFGCYPSVLIEMMDNYNFSDLYAENTSKLPLDFVAKTYVTQDIPVLVWATIEMGQSYLTDSWYVEDENGEPTKEKYIWRANEHCLVLVGYDKKYYYFSDPLSYQDVTKYEKKLVEKRYKEIGSYSMLIRKYE